MQINTGMTQDQEKLFICAMQYANASGAVHRYDCLDIFIRSHPDQKEAAIAAFAAYERKCGYCPEASFRLEEMSDDLFFLFVTSYCEKLKQEREKSKQAIAVCSQ